MRRIGKCPRDSTNCRPARHSPPIVHCLSPKLGLTSSKAACRPFDEERDHPPPTDLQMLIDARFAQPTMASLRTASAAKLLRTARPVFTAAPQRRFKTSDSQSQSLTMPASATGVTPAVRPANAPDYEAHIDKATSYVERARVCRLRARG